MRDQEILGHTYGKYYRRSDKELLCVVAIESVSPFLYALHPSSQVPYPVPHCSTLVTFSCRRLLSHANNSCLRGAFRQRDLATHGSPHARSSHLDSPITGSQTLDAPQEVSVRVDLWMEEDLAGRMNLHLKEGIVVSKAVNPDMYLLCFTVTQMLSANQSTRYCNRIPRFSHHISCWFFYCPCIWNIR